MNEASLGRARSVVLTTISQGCSAGSNFVIILVLGRFAGASEVGKFVLAQLAYGAALGLQRAMVTDALLARPAGSTTAAQDEVDRATMCSLTLALIAFVVVGAAGLLSPYHQLAILAPFLIGMLVQDASRFILLREGYSAAAAMLDALWFVISCSAFLIVPHFPGYTAPLVIWGTGGALTGVIGLGLIGFRPTSLVTSLRWWRTHLWPSSRWLSLDTAVFNAELQVTGYGFTELAGSAAFGTYQIAGSLVAVSAFFTGALNIITVRHLSTREDNQLGTAYRVALVSVASVALVTGFLVVFKHFVITTLYHDKVHMPTSVLLVAGAIAGSIAAGGGLQTVLRARRRERPMPLTRVATFLVFPALAVALSGHHFLAALWVLAAEQFTYFVVVLISARRAVRGSSPDGSVGMNDSNTVMVAAPTAMTPASEIGNPAP